MTRVPRSSASFQHNVEKALDTLRQRQGMRPERLYCAPQVLQGHQPTIVALLKDVRRAYSLPGQ